MTKEERSWILYDVGNSAFVLVMVTAIMPIFFKDYSAASLPAATSTSYWGFANSTASLILALSAPFLGTLADRNNKKKLFFTVFLLFGLSCTLLITVTQENQWLLCLAVFVMARTGWAGANIFYDAFLTDITKQDRMDIISARGYGYGYIGSVIPFLLIVCLLLSGKTDTGFPVLQIKAGFFIVAIWWFLLSVPAIKNLPRTSAKSSPDYSLASLGQSLKTLSQIRKHKDIFLFLLAYFFYIDGVGTIISMSTAYGRDMGFSMNMLMAVLLFIQIVAFPFALLYGKLAEKFSARKLLLAGISIYILITLLAFLLPFIDNLSIKTAFFWIIAFLVASSMGGIQALSRSLFSKMIPPENSCEYFGFYNVFGKFAAISGPFLMGIVTHTTGDSRWGILSILLLFVIGAILLKKVRIE